MSKALTLNTATASGTGPKPLTNVQTSYVNWPGYWPNTPITYYAYPPVTPEKYANEVEVEQGEHDATLRFYRKQGHGRRLIHEVTIPLGVLEWMQAKDD